MIIRKIFMMPDDHRPQDEIVARQEIQAELIKRMHPEGGDITAFSFDWIHHHSEKFRVAYNELSHENPEIAREWKMNREDVLRKIWTKMLEIEKRG